MTPFHPRRRQTLTLLGAGMALPALPSLAASIVTPVRTDLLTVLYRKERVNAPSRLDPVVAAATRALQDAFITQKLTVVQPDARTYQLLDQGPAMVVTFAPDAGFTLVFSLYANVRPRPGSDMVMAEVRLEGRVFVGRSILAAETGVGRMAATLTPETREFGERRSQEEAAAKAAAELAGRIGARLRALTPERLQQLLDEPPPLVAGATPVVLPPEPEPPAPDLPMPAPKRSFALLIGMSDYSSVRQRLRPHLEPGDLPGVADDVANMAKALRGMGFDKDNIRTLVNAQATSGAVRQQLMELAAKTQEDDLVLIAISAHGAPKEFGPSGFGLPVLADFGGQGDANALDFWQLQSMTGNLPARRIVLVVDTCHAGGVARLMPSAVVTAQGVEVRSGNVSPEPDAMAKAAKAHAALATRHFAVLAASRPEELSLEDPPNGGLFTSRLLRGLAASKGQLPLEQVFLEHVQKQVVQTSQELCRKGGGCKVQTPMFAYAGRGNMIRL